MGNLYRSGKDINREERKILQSFFEHSPSAKQVYGFREQLTGIIALAVLLVIIVLVGIAWGGRSLRRKNQPAKH